MRNHLLRRVGLLLPVLALGASATAPAQQNGDLRLSAWAGPHTVLGSLGRDLTESETRMESGLALGAGAEVRLPLRQFSVRLEGTGVLSTEIFTEYALGCPVRPDFSLFTNACQARSGGSYFVGSLDGVYRTNADLDEPHGAFILGIGLKRYDFDTEPTMSGLGEETVTGPCRSGDRICEIHVNRGYAGTNTDPAVHMGFSLAGRVGRVQMGLEVSDYVSLFDHVAPSGLTVQDAVHDLFLKIRIGHSVDIF